MSRTLRVSLILILFASLSACIAGGRGGTRVDRGTLTSDEIRQAGYADAYALIQALRPGWFTTRGQGSITQREEIKVYLDGLLMGGPEYLKQISTQSIGTIRWYDGLEAANRWGLDHGLGAIAVSTRRGTGG